MSFQKEEHKVEAKKEKSSDSDDALAEENASLKSQLEALNKTIQNHIQKEADLQNTIASLEQQIQKLNLALAEKAQVQPIKEVNAEEATQCDE